MDETKERLRDEKHKMKNQNAKNKIKRAIVAFLGIIVAGAGTAAVILTLPVSGPIITVGSITASYVACGVGGAAVLAGGIAASAAVSNKLPKRIFQMKINKKQLQRLDEISKKSTQIRDAVTSYLYFGGTFKENSTNLDNLKKCDLKPFVDQLFDPKIEKREKILELAKEILEYLQKYQLDAQNIVEGVNDAQRIFVDTWANMALN